MAKLKTGRHTGALKAQRQAEKRTSQNKGLMKKVRVASKQVLASLKAEDLKKAASSIDKAAKKKTIHWKTAARKKSRLAKAVNKGAKKETAKKAPAKKAAAKKAK